MNIYLSALILGAALAFFGALALAVSTTTPTCGTGAKCPVSWISF